LSDKHSPAVSSLADASSESEFPARAESVSGMVKRFPSGFVPVVQEIPKAPLAPGDLAAAASAPVDAGWDEIPSLDEPDPDDDGEDGPTLLQRAVEAQVSADATVRMPSAPPLPVVEEILASADARLPEPSPSAPPVVLHMAPPSSVRAFGPSTSSGAPDRPRELLPISVSVRRAFRETLAAKDPPLQKLVAVGLVAFLGTLALSAFLAWAIYLARH